MNNAYNITIAIFS